MSQRLGPECTPAHRNDGRCTRHFQMLPSCCQLAQLRIIHDDVYPTLSGTLLKEALLRSERAAPSWQPSTKVTTLARSPY